jgi:adenylate kinase family enzyme
MSIFFVLGGPGSGKSTMCKSLQSDMGDKIAYLSMGDALRQLCLKNENEHIKCAILEGRTVDPNITLQLLINFINLNKNKIILIDGYPRTIESYNTIPDNITSICKVIFLKTIDEKTLIERINGRYLEQRIDDNSETIKKRIKLYNDNTIPLINMLNKSKLFIIDVDNLSKEQVLNCIYSNNVITFS